MKKNLLVVIFLLLALSHSRGQDIPLFSQKLTNSFMYNPAIAGNDVGSITISHRNNYSAVNGAPVNNYLSVQTPFSNYRFGVGVNVYQEQVNILKNSYYSTAFAYHIHFSRFNTLSMGLSGEYNTIQLNTLGDPSLIGDLTVQRYSKAQNSPDFSFGMLYQSRLFKIGASANRLATTWLRNKDSKILSNYYSAFIQGTLPVGTGINVLEPYINYRKTSSLTNIWDLGVYYNYKRKIIVGAATRNGDIYSATVAYYLTRNLLVGYSREVIFGAVSGFLGSSNEFTLRYDFNDKIYHPDYESDFNNSVAYRRRRLSAGASNKSVGSRSPKQLKKSQKRNKPYSPNERYDKMEHLSMKKSNPTTHRSGRNTSRKYSPSRKKKIKNK